MSKEKLPPEEGKEKSSDGYIEIDLSSIKEKLDDGYERLVFGGKSRKFDGGYQSYGKGEGRLGLEPFYAKASVVCLVVTGIVFLCGTVLGANAELLIFFGFMLLLCVTLMAISFYEIRYDQDGFSTRFGKKVLRAHKWSDVTDVQDGKKVFVNGKRLWTDHNFDGFKEFYSMARAACKGKGKPVTPSEKKQKNRKKPQTKKSK